MPDNNEDINKYVTRLWRHTCLRAAGVPDFVLEESAEIVRQSSCGFDPIRDQEKISSCLFNHILEHTAQFYEPPFCLTCKNLADCPRQEDGSCDSCHGYQLDTEVYETCKDQLYRAVALLDGIYGFDANRMIIALNRLLDVLKET